MWGQSEKGIGKGMTMKVRSVEKVIKWKIGEWKREKEEITKIDKCKLKKGKIRKSIEKEKKREKRAWGREFPEIKWKGDIFGLREEMKAW